MGPINTRDPAAAARAYTDVLNWPIAVGHRYRPRQGCTCEDAACPTPGAHPDLQGFAATRGCRSEWEIETAPGAALIARTASFDALVMPRRIGMATMVALDHVAPVPCLTDTARAILLALPATGRYALSDEAPPSVELRTGSQQWIALPPSHGNRWDTPPWNEQTSAPIPLLHGGDIRPHLAEAIGQVNAPSSVPGRSCDTTQALHRLVQEHHR